MNWEEAVHHLAELLPNVDDQDMAARKVLADVAAKSKFERLSFAILDDARAYIRTSTRRLERAAIRDAIRATPVGREEYDNLTDRYANGRMTDEDFVAQVDALHYRVKTDTLPFTDSNGQKHPDHGYISGGSSKRAWSAAYFGCKCTTCLQYLEQETQLEELQDKNRAEFYGKVTGLIKEYTDQLKIEWTAELLASTFTLRNGARVTWGAATVDQHEERLAIFTSNAAANIEGAARHQAAINTLKQAAIDCLDMLKVETLT